MFNINFPGALREKSALRIKSSLLKDKKESGIFSYLQCHGYQGDKKFIEDILYQLEENLWSTWILDPQATLAFYFHPKESLGNIILKNAWIYIHKQLLQYNQKSPPFRQVFLSGILGFWQDQQLYAVTVGNMPLSVVSKKSFMDNILYSHNNIRQSQNDSFFHYSQLFHNLSHQKWHLIGLVGDLVWSDSYNLNLSDIELLSIYHPQIAYYYSQSDWSNILKDLRFANGLDLLKISRDVINQSIERGALDSIGLLYLFPHQMSV